MNMKVLVAAFVAAVAAFLFGWLIFGILLADFYSANTTVYAGLMKDPPDFLMIFLSNLFSAFLLAFIFQRWAGINSARDGAMGGFIIFLLIAVSFDLFLYATMNLFSPLVIVVDVISNAVFGALIGAITGYILGTGKKAVPV